MVGDSVQLQWWEAIRALLGATEVAGLRVKEDGQGIPRKVLSTLQVACGHEVGVSAITITLFAARDDVMEGNILIEPAQCRLLVEGGMVAASACARNETKLIRSKARPLIKVSLSPLVRAPHKR